MTTHPVPADVAVAFVEAFGRGDMAAVAGHLDEHVVFDSPQVHIAGAPAVVDAIGQFAQAVDDVTIVAVLGDDDQAMIMYDLVTGPFGTLRAADRLVVRAGRIVSDQLVFDTHEVRRAMGADQRSS